MIGMSYDDHLLHRGPGSAAMQPNRPQMLPGSGSNTSSLARTDRYSSRSMGNNLDSMHMNGGQYSQGSAIASQGGQNSCNSTASRSIAALDVLPRSDPTVIFNENSLIRAQLQSQQPRRLLPPNTRDTPTTSLCHNFRSRYKD